MNPKQSFSDYKSYEDFCQKTGLSGKKAIETLQAELQRLKDQQPQTKPSEKN